MAHWLPRPVLSAMLLGTWLLLQNSLALTQILSGAILALLLPIMLRLLLGSRRRIYRPLLLLRFIAIVMLDILTANFHIAWRVLRPNRLLRPAHIEIPLTLRDEFAIAVLASTITLTPGTASTRISDDRRTLEIHALHVEDEAALIAQIKQRYETPLREIFEC
jgi:multicomponent K+:H+ antiporter subunit E